MRFVQVMRGDRVVLALNPNDIGEIEVGGLYPEHVAIWLRGGSHHGPFVEPMPTVLEIVEKCAGGAYAKPLHIMVPN